jgi:hypothetical protein
VRVFPARDSIKAVVTIYGSEGQVTSAFTLVPGKQLAANPTPEKAEDGVRRDQLSVATSLTDAADEGDEDDTDNGEITYKTNAMLGYTAHGIMAMDHVTFFKNGHAIRNTAEFYDAIEDRSKASVYRDQSATYKSRRRIGGVMGSLGYVGVTVFGTWALVNGVDDDASATVPLGLTVVSLLVAIGGHAIFASADAPQELSGDEGIKLAKQYNKKRRAGLGSNLRFSPSASPTGGGVAFGGSF